MNLSVEFDWYVDYVQIKSEILNENGAIQSVHGLQVFESL